MTDNPTNSACEPMREQLSAYIDGELTRDEAAAVSNHLATCEACSAAERKLRKLTGLVAGLPRRKAPVDLAARVMAQIRAGATEEPAAPAPADRLPNTAAASAAARSHAPAAQPHTSAGSPPRAHVPASRRAITYLRVAAVALLALGLGLWVFMPRLERLAEQGSMASRSVPAAKSTADGQAVGELARLPNTAAARAERKSLAQSQEIAMATDADTAPASPDLGASRIRAGLSDARQAPAGPAGHGDPAAPAQPYALEKWAEKERTQETGREARLDRTSDKAGAEPTETLGAAPLAPPVPGATAAEPASAPVPEAVDLEWVLYVDDVPRGAEQVTALFRRLSNASTAGQSNTAAAGPEQAQFEFDASTVSALPSETVLVLTLDSSAVNGVCGQVLAQVPNLGSEVAWLSTRMDDVLDAMVLKDMQRAGSFEAGEDELADAGAQGAAGEEAPADADPPAADDADVAGVAPPEAAPEPSSTAAAGAAERSPDTAAADAASRPLAARGKGRQSRFRTDAVAGGGSTAGPAELKTVVLRIVLRPRKAYDPRHDQKPGAR